MRRRSRGLGSSGGKHTVEGQGAVKRILREASHLSAMAKNRQCQAATMAYAEMMQARGAAEAHTRSGGKGIWIPTTEIQEASFLYNENCIRESGNLGRARARRRR